jgi:hypothetical protein
VLTVRHDDLWDALVRLLPGQLTDVLGVIVSRSPAGDTWTVRGGPPGSLLVSIDALLHAAGYVWASGILPPPAPAEPPHRHHRPHREFLSHGHSRNASLTRAAREAPRPERALDRPWEVTLSRQAR